MSAENKNQAKITRAVFSYGPEDSKEVNEIIKAATISNYENNFTFSVNVEPGKPLLFGSLHTNDHQNFAVCISLPPSKRTGFVAEEKTMYGKMYGEYQLPKKMGINHSDFKPALEKVILEMRAVFFKRYTESLSDNSSIFRVHYMDIFNEFFGRKFNVENIRKLTHDEYICSASILYKNQNTYGCFIGEFQHGSNQPKKPIKKCAYVIFKHVNNNAFRCRNYEPIPVEVKGTSNIFSECVQEIMMSIAHEDMKDDLVTLTNVSLNKNAFSISM